MNQELQQHIPLRPPPRYMFSAPHKEIKLRSAAEETVRRSGGSSDEGAWGEVRLKMILENRRLKSSLEQLRREIDNHREGEIKIAEVLRESQAKLTDYRTRLRQKDARITLLTQQTNAQQQQLNAIQQKNNHLQAYSDWQETQIRQLQQEQVLLRECHLRETQVSRKEQIYNPLTRLTGDHTMLPSMQSLEEKDERWVSVAEMGADELEGFKQKKVTEEDYDVLVEAHHSVSSRVVELEREAAKVKTEFEAMINECKHLQAESKRKQQQWRIKMEQVKQKEQQNQLQAQQKEHAIMQLQEQINKLKKKQENEQNGESQYIHQLQNSIGLLQRELQNKEVIVVQLREKWQEQEQQLRREILYVSEQLANEQEKVQRISVQTTQQLTAAQARIATLEKTIENAAQRAEQVDSHREELEERLAHALEEQKKMTKLAEQLENQSQWLRKIEEAESYIRQLEEERQTQHEEMERYATEIRQLKVQISEMNRDRHESSRENRQRTIPEQHQSSFQEDDQEEEIQQEAPLQNQVTVKQRKSRSRTLPQQEELQIEADHRNEQEEKEKHKEERSRHKEERRRQEEERNRQLEHLQEQIERVKQQFNRQLQEQTHRHNIATIDLKFKLQKQQQDSALLFSTLNECQSKLKQAESERNELKQLVTTLIQQQKQFSTYQQELTHLQKNLQDKEAQIRLCNSEMEIMEGKLKKSKEEWKEAQERMNVLESIATHQKEQIQKEQRSRMEQTAAREALESALEDKKQEIAKLQMIIGQGKSEVQQLEKQKMQLTAVRDEMENAQATLRQQIASLDADKTVLQDNLKSLEEKIQNQEAIMKSLEQKIKIKDEEISIVHIELNESNIKMIQMEREKLLLSEEGAKREQIQRKLQEKERSLYELRSDLANLKESLQFSVTQRDQISPVQSSQNSLSLKMEDAADPPINLIKSQIASIQAKHRSLTQQFEGRNRHLLTAKAELQRRVNEEQTKNGDLVNKINNYESKIKQIQNQLQLYKQNEAKIKGQMQFIQEEKKEEGNKCQQMSILINELNRRIQQIQKDRQQLQLQNKQMQEQIAQQSQELTEQAALLDQMQIEISNYKQFNQQASAQAEAHQATISSLQKLLNEQKEELKISREQNQSIKIKLQTKEKELQGILSNFQSQKSQFKQDIQITKKLMGELQQEYDLKINKLSRQLAHSKLLLQEALQQSNSQLEISNRSVSSVRTELQLAQSALSDKDIQNKQLKDMNYQLKEQVERNNREKDEHLATIHRMQVDRQNIERQLQKVKAEIGQLHQQLQDSEKQLVKQKELGKTYQLQNAQLSEQIQHLQTTNESQATSNHQLRLQLTQLTTSLQKLQSTVQIANEKYSAVEQQLLIAQLNEKTLQREYETRIEDICLEQRQQLLEVQRRHIREAEIAAAEISRITKEEAKVRTEVDSYKSKVQEYKVQIDGMKKENQKLVIEGNKLKQEVNSLKNELGGVRNELGAVVQRERKEELQLKASENERGELTDRMLQLAQQNNELNELIQNLRNDVISKNNQIFQCRQLIEKLQQDMEARVAGSPLEAKLTEAYQFIDRLSQTNQQLKMKEDVLQAQLREKAKIERQLHEKLEATRPKQNRDRNSSGDSWVSRSKIFTDEKSQNLHAELEDTKLKLQSAQAYIIQLEDECQKLSQNQDPQNKPLMQKRCKELQVENDDLKIKVEYLQAYVEQLESFNLKSSIRSRKSVYSRKEDGKKEESVHKEQNSRKQENHRKEEVKADRSKSNNGERISLLIDFVQNYSKEASCGERQEELRRQLQDPLLQELLSTIFYRLEKESGQNADFKAQLTDLEEELHATHQELNHLRESEVILTQKAKRSEALERQLEESQHQLQESVLAKMQQEAQLAQKRASLQELQNRLGKLSKEQQRAGKRQKESLEILEQQDESQSDSMMSESADSQIPSSVNQSKQFKSSVDFRTRPPNHLTLSKGLVRTKSLNITEDKQSVQFLKRCLTQVEAIQQQASSLQREVEKMREGGHSGLLAKLQEVEAKVRMSDRDLKQHLERSQGELAALVREMLRQRQEQDQYGLQTESRKRIQECLSALQQQLTRSGKFGEEQNRNHEPRRSTSPSRLKQSLQEIKEDVANQDRGSSIVTPRGQIMHQQSFTNSEGFFQAGEAAELRQGYNQIIKQLHLTHDELVTKEELLRSTIQRYSYAEAEIAAVLDELRNNFDEDQYLFDQAEKIKGFLSKAREQVSFQSFQGQGRGSGSITTILVQSNRKIEKEKEKQREKQKQKEKSKEKDKSKQQEKERENALWIVVRVDEGELRSWASGVGSQQVRQLIAKLQGILQQRFEECMEFLNMEKSLIGEILKVGSDEQALEQHLSRLAGRLTRQEISDIIAHSPNRLEAHRTLTRILHDDAPSHISNEHDFAPSGDRLQAIRNAVFPRPSELTLALHNQLLALLAAPTRQLFYENAEGFYRLLRDFEQRTLREAERERSVSQQQSQRLEEMLEEGLSGVDFSQLQKFQRLQVKTQKLRSSSCGIGVGERSD